MQAGIAYLFTRMMKSQIDSVFDPGSPTPLPYVVVAGDSFDAIAKKVGSTIHALQITNPSVRTLHPKQEILYRKATMKRVITGWLSFTTHNVGVRYNVGDPSYSAKLDYVLRSHQVAQALICMVAWHRWPWFLPVALACAHGGAANPSVAAPPSTGSTGSASAALPAKSGVADVSGDLDRDRQRVLAALRAQHVNDPHRLIVHLSHACSLTLGGRSFPVIDLQELVPGAMTRRGVNSILVLSPQLNLVRRLEYTTERPLFCTANKLYVWGDLRVDGVADEGNELTFSEDAKTVTLRQVEVVDVPAPSSSQDLFAEAIRYSVTRRVRSWPAARRATAPTSRPPRWPACAARRGFRRAARRGVSPH